MHRAFDFQFNGILKWVQLWISPFSQCYFRAF